MRVLTVHKRNDSRLLTNRSYQALTDSHSRDIGDYDALVIVQSANFREGELLLYERLQMAPMLLERYAKDGSEKSRRQMLAMSQSDPEVCIIGSIVSLLPFIAHCLIALHGRFLPKSLVFSLSKRVGC